MSVSWRWAVVSLWCVSDLVMAQQDRSCRNCPQPFDSIISAIVMCFCGASLRSTSASEARSSVACSSISLVGHEVEE